MIESLTVKKAEPDDFSTLYSISRKSYSDNFANHWNEGGLEWYLEKVFGKELITSELSGNTVDYFIAFLDDEPVGFMKLNLLANLPDHKPEEEIEISKLYFLPGHQGKGIGKKLISIAFDRAKELKKKIIWLGVIDTNEPAIEFYSKMGFTPHQKTRLDIPYFKEERKGMWLMKSEL